MSAVPDTLNSSQLGQLLAECALATGLQRPIHVPHLGEFMLAVPESLPTAPRRILLLGAMSELISRERGAGTRASAVGAPIDFTAWLARRAGRPERWAEEQLSRIADELRADIEKDVSPSLPGFCTIAVRRHPSGRVDRETGQPLRVLRVRGVPDLLQRAATLPSP